MHKTHSKKQQFFLGINVYAETISTKHFNFQFAVKLRICFSSVSCYADAYSKKASRSEKKLTRRIIDALKSFH